MAVFKLEKIRKLAAKQGISERRLSTLSGLSPSAVPEMIKRNRALPSTILKVAKVLRVDVSELYSDDGEIEELASRGRNIMREIAQELRYSYQGTEGALPMVTMDMLPDESRTLAQVLDTDIGDTLKKYVLPHVARADYLMPMIGHTMSPQFDPGDVLICQYLGKPQLGLELGGPYVIETVKGFFFRNIIEHEPHTILCESPNEKYPQFLIGWEYVISVSKIVGYVRLT